jgi:hypothetical protein
VQICAQVHPWYCGCCMLHAACCVLCALCNVLYAVCNVLYAVCFMLYAVCYVLYAVCSMQYAVAHLSWEASALFFFAITSYRAFLAPSSVLTLSSDLIFFADSMRSALSSFSIWCVSIRIRFR